MDKRQLSIDNDYAEALSLFKEIESSLIVLQQAVQLEDGLVTLSNIDDNLELINQRLSLAIKKFTDTYDKQFVIAYQRPKTQIKDLGELQES